MRHQFTALVDNGVGWEYSKPRGGFWAYCYRYEYCPIRICPYGRRRGSFLFMLFSLLIPCYIMPTLSHERICNYLLPTIYIQPPNHTVMLMPWMLSLCCMLCCCNFLYFMICCVVYYYIYHIILKLLLLLFIINYYFIFYYIIFNLFKI